MLRTLLDEEEAASFVGQIRDRLAELKLHAVAIGEPPPSRRTIRLGRSIGDVSILIERLTQIADSPITIADGC
jgi:hypothetical protein